jgi:hypothetical protein
VNVPEAERLESDCDDYAWDPDGQWDDLGNYDEDDDDE